MTKWQSSLPDLEEHGNNFGNRKRSCKLHYNKISQMDKSMLFTINGELKTLTCQHIDKTTKRICPWCVETYRTPFQYETAILYGLEYTPGARVRVHYGTKQKFVTYFCRVHLQINSVLSVVIDYQ